jgi:hypothetical protein
MRCHFLQDFPLKSYQPVYFNFLSRIVLTRISVQQFQLIVTIECNMLRFLLSAILSVIISGLATAQSSTFLWAFIDSAGTPTGSMSGVTVSAMTVGNTLGTVTAINTTAPSSGYTGASGLRNICNAMRTGALDTAVNGSGYFSFTVTNNLSVPIYVNDFDFGIRSAVTGSQAYTLRSSLDTFTTDVSGVSGTLANDSTWIFKDHTIVTSLAINAGVSAEIRLYGFNGTGSAVNSFPSTRLDDIQLSLSTAPVPEPISIVGFAGLAYAGYVMRRRVSW